MWSLYSIQNGVAVKTTAAKLEVALRDAPHDIEISTVQYELISAGFMAGSPWKIKRPSFAHERELRAAFREPECGVPGIGVPIDVDALIEEVYVSPESDLWIEAVIRDIVSKYGCTKAVKRSDLYTLR
jgi:hypothetical protein